MTDYAANLRARKLSPYDIKWGKRWYPVALSIAKALTPDEPERGAAILAALSPRQSWHRTVENARLIIEAASLNQLPPDVTLGRNVDKAYNLALGNYSNPEEWLNQSPGAFKVNRFYHNILGETQHVTVDTWAALAAGEPSPAISGSRYLAIERAYQEVSRDYNMTPRDYQAAIWCQIRGELKNVS